MLYDLATAENDQEAQADVLVIGSGVAGLLLATELRRHNVRVVVLESGAREQPTETHEFNRVVQLGTEYRGATYGRFRCLGGTSTRWGGALIPFLEGDLEPRPHLGLPAWPVGLNTLLPYLAQIERIFGVDGGSYDEKFISEFGDAHLAPARDDFVPRFAKWPVFRKRNLATLFGETIGQDPSLAVWMNATATDFGLDRESGRLRSVTARHLGGRKITVTAGHVVVCAGAIESTRLLLLLDAQHQGRVFEANAALGRYLNDHISIRVAAIESSHPDRLNRLAGMRFVGRTIRSLRFEMSPEAQAREGVASAFAHIAFMADEDNGFAALRDFLRTLQQSGRIQTQSALKILADMPYLARIGLWRLFYKQLYWPTPAQYDLHLVSEQLPHPDNRIALAEQQDAFGNRLAAIDWNIRPPDLDVLRTFIRLFQAYWQRHGYDSAGRLGWSVDPDGSDIMSAAGGGYDIFHPCGSTRMGADAHSAVVDKDLRAFSVQNLWVASTSVFPSGASANPTLMLMLLTLRLAQHLARTLKTS